MVGKHKNITHNKSEEIGAFCVIFFAYFKLLQQF